MDERTLDLHKGVGISVMYNASIMPLSCGKICIENCGAMQKKIPSLETFCQSVPMSAVIMTDMCAYCEI